MARPPNPAFEDPFNEDRQGVVTAAGELEVTFKNTSRLTFVVEQVTGKMPTAPAGSNAELRWQNVLVAPAFSAKKFALGQSPPVTVRPGETIAVVWENCTPGDTGIVLFIYRKKNY